jgi:hypothetical protein
MWHAGRKRAAEAALHLLIAAHEQVRHGAGHLATAGRGLAHSGDARKVRDEGRGKQAAGVGRARGGLCATSPFFS